MAGLQWLLDLTLVLLLAATLFHALRLERALGVLKRDRGALEALVAEFNGSTREAQGCIDTLRNAADGAGRAIARQTEAATGLRDDLVFLTERGEKLADRLDHLVRAGRSLTPEPGTAPASIAARTDWRALLEAQLPVEEAPSRTAARAEGTAREPAAREPSRAGLLVASAGRAQAAPPAGAERVRSQAERNLLAALRMAR